MQRIGCPARRTVFLKWQYHKPGAWPCGKLFHPSQSRWTNHTTTTGRRCQWENPSWSRTRITQVSGRRGTLTKTRSVDFAPKNESHKYLMRPPMFLFHVFGYRLRSGEMLVPLPVDEMMLLFCQVKNIFRLTVGTLTVGVLIRDEKIAMKETNKR